jgi:hypothetical protein
MINMKKNILWALIFPIMAISSLSCEKLVEVKETDFIAGATALRTVKNNESLLIGAYNIFEPEMAIRLNGVFSDELKPGDFYNATTTHEWQWGIADVGIRDTYTAITPLYRIIDRANRVLEALPGAIVEAPSDNALRDKVKGEALFLRAYAHFELFRYYSKNYTPTGLAMPYLETPSLEPQARIVMSEYFKKLLADLTASKPLMANNVSDVYRANRVAATGLHARVALYMGNWADAITYSTEYINILPLATRAEFPGIWSDANKVESALKLFRTNGSRMGSFYSGLFTRNAAGALVAPASISWVPSSKLFESYDKVNDIRFGVSVKEEPILAAIPNKPSKIVAKYLGTGYATNNENVGDIKVFRTAEMYLIRAEARAESNSISGANSAESDLNALRAARITGYTNVTLTSKENAITEIMQERFKELAFEGHRFWDLKRRGLPVQRIAVDAPSPQGTTLPANNFRFVLPIPQAEMQANPKMVQNEGYSN